MIEKFEGQHGSTTYIVIERVLAISIIADYATVMLEAFDKAVFLTPEEGHRLATLIGGAAPSNDAPTSPAGAREDGEYAHIVRIERGEFYSKTSGEYSPMWRCQTAEGMGFNIFKHADPLRNTYKLFQDALYAELLDPMELDEVLYFHDHPIHVRLEQDGQYWKPVGIAANPGIQPDVVAVEEEIPFAPHIEPLNFDTDEDDGADIDAEFHTNPDFDDPWNDDDDDE